MLLSKPVNYCPIIAFNRLIFGKLWSQNSLLLWFLPSSLPFCSRCPLLAFSPHLDAYLALVLTVWLPIFSPPTPHPEIWYLLHSEVVGTSDNCCHNEPQLLMGMWHIFHMCWFRITCFKWEASEEEIALSQGLEHKTKWIKCEEQVFRHMALGRVRNSCWHFKIPEIKLQRQEVSPWLNSEP